MPGRVDDDRAVVEVEPVAHLVAVADGHDLAGVGGDPHVALVHLDVAEVGAAQRLAGLAAGRRELREAADDEVGGDAFFGAHWARSIGADAAHPAARVRTLAELHEAIAGCRMCPRVTPPPILWAREGQRALIIGQAPGITEPLRGLPFAGAAGRKLVTLAGAARHHRPRGACSSASRSPRWRSATRAACPGGRGDRAPDRGERERCRPWTDALVRLCDPAVVVPVGRLAIDDWLGPAPLSEVVGRRFERDGRVIVPLPHPSGASAWTNDAANRALVAECRRTAARHAPLTGRHEGVTGAEPSVRGRGARPGNRRDGSPLGARRAAPADRRGAARRPASRARSSHALGAHLPHAAQRVALARPTSGRCATRACAR